MSPPYYNMGVCLTAIPVRAKKLHYRSTLRDPQRKTEPTIGHLLAIPVELEIVILSEKAYALEILKWTDPDVLNSNIIIIMKEHYIKSENYLLF
ncbi:hypothetical protein H8356DRAFT_1417404 [Neocallimastix lanati (nom. inval.)]|nr:hypothetical protein H8356DRAFT_1417404 [Neocallimastix sp. JGI-2020a]